MSTRYIKRYCSEAITTATGGSDILLLTIDENIDYAQIVDLRLLTDTSDYDDLHSVRFGLWAINDSGEIIARFFPKNFQIENFNTQFFVAFDHYIQLPAGTKIYCSANIDDQEGGKDFSIYVNATIETYA